MSVFGILLLLALMGGVFYWMVRKRRNAALFQQPFFSLRSPKEEEEEESIWQQWELDEDMDELQNPKKKLQSNLKEDLSPDSAQKSKSFFAGRRVLIYLSFFLLAIALSVGSYYLGRYHQRLATPIPKSSPTTTQVSFRDAVNYATSAAEKAQTAETPQQWRQVANLWEKAIAGMKSVPTSRDEYNMAQEKVKEYQKYLQYAQQNAEKASESK